MFKKSVPAETVTRNVSLVLISMGIIGFVLFMILAGELPHGGDMAHPSGSFLAYFFEAVSAFGTVGLSMDIRRIKALK